MIISEAIDTLLNEATRRIPTEKRPNLPNNKLGLLQWNNFEYDIWAVGEKIRQLLLSSDKIVLSEGQITIIISIINNPNASRGRQPFIWLLGKRKYSKFASEIIGQIIDDTVSLHIFDTIYKMRALGYAKELLEWQERFQPLAPERKKLKRYLEDFK